MLKFVLIIGLLTGCEEFQNPSNLPKHQVIAMQASPASIAPGETTIINVVVAGPTGIETPGEITREVVPATGSEETLGSVTTLADGTAEYTGPASIDEDPTIAAVEATVTTDTGTLRSIKFIVLSNLVQLTNPTITAVTVDGSDVTAGWSYTPGATSSLQVTTEPEMTDDAAFAWYTSAGEIGLYQDNPTEILLPEQSVQGRLIVVVRDGMGGIAYSEVEMTTN